MILVFGTICLDRIRRIDHWPRVGGYAEIRSDIPFLGGEAANTASHLARWGADVVLLGNGLGHGERAAHLRQLIALHALSDEYLVDTGNTPVCDVYLTPDGERTMLGRGFARMDLPISVDDTPWRRGAWFTAEPNMGAPAREMAARAARESMKVYLMDFNQPSDVIPEGAFWQGSTDWMGTPGDIDGNLRLVDAWVAKHGCFATLTDAAHGYVFGGPGIKATMRKAPIAPKVLDATGAGDAFRAGMLFSLDQGRPIDECLRFAAACGALKCGALGGSSAKFSVAEAQALADQA